MQHTTDGRRPWTADGLFAAFRSWRCERFIARVADAFTSEGGGDRHHWRERRRSCLKQVHDNLLACVGADADRLMLATARRTVDRRRKTLLVLLTGQTGAFVVGGTLPLMLLIAAVPIVSLANADTRRRRVQVWGQLTVPVRHPLDAFAAGDVADAFAACELPARLLTDPHYLAVAARSLGEDDPLVLEVAAGLADEFHGSVRDVFAAARALV